MSDQPLEKKLNNNSSSSSSITSSLLTLNTQNISNFNDPEIPGLASFQNLSVSTQAGATIDPDSEAEMIEESDEELLSESEIEMLTQAGAQKKPSGLEDKRSRPTVKLSQENEDEAFARLLQEEEYSQKLIPPSITSTSKTKKFDFVDYEGIANAFATLEQLKQYDPHYFDVDTSDDSHFPASNLISSSFSASSSASSSSSSSSSNSSNSGSFSFASSHYGTFDYSTGASASSTDQPMNNTMSGSGSSTTQEKVAPPSPK